MPELNARANSSMVFTDVLANASWTKPSVASFFTGLAPEEHGAMKPSYPIAPDAVTLAEVLQRRGYETAAFVANHAAVNRRGGFDRGFDHFEPLQQSTDDYDRADFVTSRVSEWITDRQASSEPRPLFLYIHYLDPHIPYLSSGGTQSAESHDEAHDLYDAEVRFLDGELARLFRALDDRLAPSRVMLIVSDHGEEFGEHGGRGHGKTLYSEVLHIPVILSFAPIFSENTPVVIDDPLEGRDFFEILLRIVEDPKADVRRRARLLSRTTRVASVSAALELGAIHYLVRPYLYRIYMRIIQRDRWKLIWSAYGPTRELYDLRDDPHERINQLARRRALATSLTAELDMTPPAWRRGGEVELSEETIKRLRALGYVR